jgi:hypothetical protein
VVNANTIQGDILIMAGSKLNTYGVGDVNLTNLMQVLDATRLGFSAIELTEWTTTTVPKIAAGSKVEVNGAMYKFDADETITGSPSDGLVYIKVVPSGDSITAEFTNTAPTWRNDLHGYYESAVSVNRYVATVQKATSSYTRKRVYAWRYLQPMQYETQQADTTVGAGSTLTATFNFTFGFDVAAIASIDTSWNHIWYGHNDRGGWAVTSLTISGKDVTVVVTTAGPDHGGATIGIVITAIGY